jgi:hypothetical protein|tara:strand:+ start:8139 stop:8504 length:366 start_codon:yes stop_codon:yes gene_type:complete
MNITNSGSSEGLFDNKYIIGIIMVVINLGARFIVNELNEEQKKWINSKYLRRILIFLVVFMATRDIVISIILTIVVIMVIFEFFNEDSDYSLVPKVEKNSESDDLDKNQKIDKIIEELKTI